MAIWIYDCRSQCWNRAILKDHGTRYKAYDPFFHCTIGCRRRGGGGQDLGAEKGLGDQYRRLKGELFFLFFFYLLGQRRSGETGPLAAGLPPFHGKSRDPGQRILTRPVTCLSWGQVRMVGTLK